MPQRAVSQQIKQAAKVLWVKGGRPEAVIVSLSMAREVDEELVEGTLVTDWGDVAVLSSHLVREGDIYIGSEEDVLRVWHNTEGRLAEMLGIQGGRS